MEGLIIDTSVQGRKIARRVSGLVPDKIRKILEDNEDMRDSVYLCGGAFVSIASNERVRDLDFFFCSATAYEWFKAEVLKDLDLEKINVFETDNCYGFRIDRMKIQLIKKLYFPDGIKECIGVFDFRACMWGMTGTMIIQQDELIRHSDAIFDIAKREMFIMPNHRHPFNVTFRIVKYARRGWTIKGLSFIRLVLQQLIRAQNIKTLADVKEEIIGIDTLVLAEFFKDSEELFPDKQIGALELTELLHDIEGHFEDWQIKQTEFKDDSVGDEE